MTNSKVINIHQSFWGEVNHGHGLIATSLNDDTLNQVLSSFSDRPGLTYSQSIQPYFSGKKIGNYFVFTKSYPDNTASRAGMVFTHALIFNIEDIIDISNIDFVFDLFSEELPEKPTLNANVTHIQKRVVCCSDDKILYPKYLQSVVQLLIKEQLPVIFSGKTSNFTFIITQIWKGIFPAIRENLSFQIAFTPNDIQQNKNLSLVFVPNTFIDKWITYTFVDDSEDFNVQIENEIERLLLGDLESNDFYTFLQNLDIKPDSFKTISICYRAYALYNKLNTCTVSESLQLVRSLVKLSPQNKNNQIKSKSIDCLCHLLPSASEEDIKGLRNIDFSSFEEGNVKITKSIEQFLDIQFQKTELSHLSQFIFEVFETKEGAIWWHKTIIHKISQILKSQSISIVWDLINHQKNLLEHFAPHIDITSEKESQFLSLYPKKLNSELAKTIKDFAVNRKWFRLFGRVNLEINSPQNALQEQISLEKDVDLYYQYSGLNIIVNVFSDTDFFKFAIETDTDKLNRIAADKCIKNPQLLSQLDVQIAAWRKIWVYSLEKTNNLSLGISDIQSTVFTIFDLLLKDIPIDNLIIEKISKSEHANIKEYSGRKNLWNKLPTNYQSEFISKTSDAIINSILSGNNEEVEPIIEEKILSDNYIDRVCNKNPLKSILLIYDKFTNLPEKYLLAGIKKHVGDLEESDSNKLGLLIRQKKWEISAEAVFDKAKYNTSFRTALNHCKSLIPRWKRFWHNDLFNETSSEKDYYDSFCELLGERETEKNNIHKSILTNKGQMKKILFVTALQLEFDAVKSYLIDIESVKHLETGTYYGKGIFIKNEIPCEVYIVETGAGNIRAAEETSRAISFFVPDYVFFVGVAGGIKDVALGDVVASTKIIGYEMGKADDVFKPRHDVFQSSYELEQLAKHVNKDVQWKNKPNCFVAPIAAGEKIVSSTRTETYEQLKKNCSDALAVEMEGAGFLQAVRVHSLDGIVIRGISDLLEHKEEADKTGSQPVAAKNAAAFAFQMVAELIKTGNHSLLSPK